MRHVVAVLLGSLCLVAACRAEDGDGDLLERIIAVQRAHRHVQGIYRYHNVPPDEPAAAKRFWTGRFAFARPSRYRVHLIEEGQDGFEEYRSDGEWYWQVVSIDPAMAPVVKRLPVDEADQKWARVGRFILFDREVVARDFSMAAEPVAAGDARALAPAVRSQVILTPTTDAMKQHLQGAVVQFDAEHRVIAVRIRDNSDNLMTAVVKEADYETPPPDKLFRWGP